MKRDYYLPACMVIFAAAIGNRKACHFAIENLPAARRWAADNQPKIYEEARRRNSTPTHNPGTFFSSRKVTSKKN